MSIAPDWDREMMKAELRRAKAELDAAQAESLRLYEKRVQAHGPARKKKLGRPTVWRGLIGYHLVEAVEEIQAKCELDPEECKRYPGDYPKDALQYAGRRISLAQAIRRAIKNHPILRKDSTIVRASDRTLQARYQQAADSWSKTRRGALDSEVDAASERWRLAIEHFNEIAIFWMI